MLTRSLCRVPRRRCPFARTAKIVATIATCASVPVATATPPQCQTRWLDGVPTSDISYSGSYVGGVRSLTMWDPDGDGPEPERLVAGGAFDTIGGIGSPQVAAWVPGERSFRALGDGFTGFSQLGPLVSAVASVPNSEGGNDLYAAGNIANYSGVPVNGIARWDGTSWGPLGVGLSSFFGIGNNPVSSMIACADGRLVVVGSFSVAGGMPATGLAIWNGSAWSVPATVAGGNVNAVACLPDGSLIIGGTFSSVNGDPIEKIARITNGVAAPMSGEQIANVTSLAITSDGRVFATSVIASGTRVVQYADGSWTQIGAVTSTASSNPGVPKVFALSDNSIAMFGAFTAIDGAPMSNLARYNGASWEPLGPPESPYAAAQLPDGRIVTARTNLRASDEQSTSVLLGQVPQLTNGVALAVEYFEGDLVVAGNFTAIQGVPVTNVARRTASGWQQMGSLQGVTDLFNFNGALYAAGTFTGHVARWNGAQWVVEQPAAVAASSTQHRLGAHEDSLVLTHYNGHTNVAILTDGQWLSLPSFRTIRMAAEIASFEGHVYAGGRAGSVFSRFNGAQWEPVNVIANQPSVVTSLAQHQGRLYICLPTPGAPFNSANSWTVGYLQGQAFFEIGRIALPIRAFASTSDGDLYAMSEQSAMYRIRDGSIRVAFGGLRGFDTLLDLSQLATGPDGRIAFARTRSYGGSDFAELLDPRPVALRDVPDDMPVCDDARAAASITVLGTLDRTIRWQWNGSGDFAPIVDGFVAGLGIVSGTETDTLQIDQADPAALGTMVRLVASDACTTATSASIALVPGPADSYACARCAPCAADFDQDGAATPADLAAFIAEFRNGRPCADVDQDGGITGADIGAFFLVFEAGGC